MKKHGSLANIFNKHFVGLLIFLGLVCLIIFMIITICIYDEQAYLGVEDRELSMLATRKNANSGGNSCRHMHSFVARTGKQLPVEVKHVKTPVRKVTKARVHEVETNFPTLPLSSWMKASFDLGGHFFLGGKDINHFDQFSRILVEWWKSYKMVDPDLPFFQDFGEECYGTSFPVALHGDEGRGRYKRPIMIYGYQPLITNFDGKSNLKGSGVC